MFTFNVSLAVLLSVVLLTFLNEKNLQVEASQCYSNSDCSYYYYCCKQRYYYQSHVCGYGGCVGQPCSSDSDCGGPGECCRSYYCTKSGCTTNARPYGCSSNSDCSYYYYCCKRRYYYQSHVCGYGGCVGQPCSSDRDCGGPGECCRSYYCTKSGCTTTARPYGCSSNLDCSYNYYCCKQRYYYQSHVCSYGDCLGESCSLDSDCGGPDECCSSSNRCKRSSCAQFPSWFIPVIVVSVVIFIAIVVGCCYRLIMASHRRPQVGVVIGQQPRPTVIALQNTQSGHPLPPHPSVHWNQAQGLPPAQAQAQVPPPAYKYDVL